MTLITRQGKGYRLTIEELDGNLEYLETLGVKEIYQDGNKVVLERPDNSISEITIDNNLPVVVKKIIGDGEFVTYKGILKYDFESSTNIIPLKYNIDKDTLSDIEGVWGKTYYFSGTILTCSGDSCVENEFYGYLESNINYDPSNPFYVNLEGIGVIEIQSDGKILVGGYVYELNDNKYILRLNTNGEVDNTFNIGSSFNNQTLSIKIQSDGKILVGGRFTDYNGTSVNRIVRLNSNGSIDNTFNVGTGIGAVGSYNDGVFSIQTQSDGKILLGGQFTEYNGTSVNNIVRLNSDGSIDNTFDIGTGFNDFIRTIQIQSNGKILVGGHFTSYNETSVNRLVSLNSDGSIDNTFNVGAGFNNIVRVTQTQTNGKILVGGHFTSYNGTSYNKMIRLNSDGSIDNTFNIGTGFGSQNYNTVRVIQIQSDGKILVGGGFEVFNGDEDRVYLIRLNSNGSIDSAFDIKRDDVGDNYVQSIAIHPDGNILVGGWNGFFRFSFDGVSTMGSPKFNDPTSPLRISDGKLNVTVNEFSDSVTLQYELIETNFKK